LFPVNAPSAKRKTLVLLAGFVWTVVGIVLVLMAARWLLVSGKNGLYSLGLGLIGGAIVYWLGFDKLAQANLIRIYAQAPAKDKVCVFAFQNTRSYIIIPVMILMGYMMRHLPVSKIYIIPVYVAIGLGLILASLRYYHSLIGAPEKKS
jgi:hypothetical protein